MRTYTRGPYRKSYLVRHGNGWKFKQAVPADLQNVVGRKAWIKNLGTRTRAEAEIEAHQLAAMNKLTIARLRGLTPAERAQVEANAGIGSYTKHVRVTEFVIPFVALGANPAFASPDPDVPDSEQAAQALELFRAGQELAKLQSEAAAGRRLLSKVAATSPQAGAKELENLIGLWQRVSQPRARQSVDKMHLVVRRFVELVGDVAPAQVTRTHVMTFRDKLEQMPKLSHANARQHLEKLHRLFAVALSEGLVEANPVHGIKVRKLAGKFADDHRRRAFETKHVRAIFKAMKDETPDFQWMMRLLAYHGMRSGEAAQLRIDDVTTLAGVSVLRVHDKYGSLKNRFSQRDIPIHPACKDIVAYAKAAEGPWLFGSFPDSAKGRADQFQRHAGVFLRKRVGITDRSLTVHSLRHLWRTLARELDMPEPVSRAIMGHALGRDDHAGYGDVPSLKSRAQWMMKINPLA